MNRSLFIGLAALLAAPATLVVSCQLLSGGADLEVVNATGTGAGGTGAQGGGGTGAVAPDCPTGGGIPGEAQVAAQLADAADVTGEVMVKAIASDRWGNVLVVGSHTSGTLSGCTEQTGEGERGFVVKLNTTLDEVLWCKSYVGGTVRVNDVDTDAAGNVYLGGEFLVWMRVGEDDWGASGLDGFVARLASDGTLEWFVKLGTSGDQSVSAVAFSPRTKRLWVGGQAVDILWFRTGNSGAELEQLLELVDGGQDLFVMDIEADGSAFRTKLRYGGGDATLDLEDLAVGPDGEVVFAGTMRPPTSGPPAIPFGAVGDAVLAGATTGFVARLPYDDDPSNVAVDWLRTVVATTGDTSNEKVLAAAIDNGGRIAFSGTYTGTEVSFQAADGDPVSGAPTMVHGGGVESTFLAISAAPQAPDLEVAEVPTNSGQQARINALASMGSTFLLGGEFEGASGNLNFLGGSLQYSSSQQGFYGAVAALPPTGAYLHQVGSSSTFMGGVARDKGCDAPLVGASFQGALTLAGLEDLTSHVVYDAVAFRVWPGAAGP